MRAAIIGAGIAGLSCARALRALGHEVTCLDKGRGAGGRLAVRRVATASGEVCFDAGAQYFTARSDEFRRVADAWVAAGVAARWPAAGNDALVGVPAMNALVHELAANQRICWATRVTGLARRAGAWQLETEQGGNHTADAVIVAVPAEQAAELLTPVAPALAQRARAVNSAPCWTLMLAFTESLAVAGDCWRGDGALGWAARNSAKPGRSGPEAWVLQAGPDWSARHLDATADWVTTRLTAAAAELLGIDLPTPAAVSCQRWRYARSGGEGSLALWDPALRIGACGDWLIGPRIEAAWLSGSALARRLATAGGGDAS